MERPEELATRIDNARVMARTGVEVWANLACENINAKVDASHTERATNIIDANLLVSQITHEHNQSREQLYANYRVDAEEKIRAAEVAEDERTSLRTWLNDYNIAHVKPVREKHDLDATTTNHNSVAKNQEAAATIRTTLDNYVTHNTGLLQPNQIVDLGLLSLEKRIADITANTIHYTESLYFQLLDRTYAIRDEHSTHLRGNYDEFKEVINEALQRLDAMIADAQTNSSYNQYQEDTSPPPHDNSPNQEEKDPRIARIMGLASNLDQQAVVNVLANVDLHRKKGKDDAKIYRILVRNFHPDVYDGDEDTAAGVIQVLGLTYNQQTKRFHSLI